jgi:hypothetical protein
MMHFQSLKAPRLLHHAQRWRMRFSLVRSAMRRKWLCTHVLNALVSRRAA